MKTLSNEKGAKSDSLAVRQELQARGMMKELHPRSIDAVDREGNPIFIYANAPWVWSSTEYKVVLATLKKIRFPTNYGSSLAYKISEKKMVGLKTHDWHNILHDLLPIAIRGTLTRGIRETVYRLSRFFKKLCLKEVKIVDMPGFEEEAAELATMMEMHLPPQFFDIQPHEIVHLPKELLWAGPVRPRWMYFVERYMKVLKGWVRQMAWPESSIAEGYITHEAMKYAAEFVSEIDPHWDLAWTDEDESMLTGNHLPKASSVKVMTRIYREQAHNFVLKNHPSMAGWQERYNRAKESDPNLDPFRIWVEKAVRNAVEEGETISPEIYDISRGPNAKADLFSGTCEYIAHNPCSVLLTTVPCYNVKLQTVIYIILCGQLVWSIKHLLNFH